MINNDMRLYDYYAYAAKDAYGQPALSSEPVGKVKIAIYITSQATQDNINYRDAKYVGITHALLNDSNVIQYGDTKLKVLYVNPQGRFKQVFLTEI